MKKKGQGLPLNVIIIAVIVLVVLIVLFVIFTDRAGKFSENLAEQDKELDAVKLADQLKQCGSIPLKKCQELSNGRALKNCVYQPASLSGADPATKEACVAKP